MYTGVWHGQMSVWKDPSRQEPGGEEQGSRRTTEEAAAQVQMLRHGWQGQGRIEVDRVKRDLKVELTGFSDQLQVGSGRSQSLGWCPVSCLDYEGVEGPLTLGEKRESLWHSLHSEGLCHALWGEWRKRCCLP